LFFYSFFKNSKIILNTIKKEDAVFWFHSASLGEYIQAEPLIKALQKKNPTVKFLLSFFSPSGYEIIKEKNKVDCVVYLPLDTKKNAKRFLEIVHPKAVFFIKNDFWANYIFELSKNKIPFFFIVSTFRKEQLFFKWYGIFFRNLLKKANYFFLQDKKSKELLEKINIKNVSIVGDTRYDKVFETFNKNISLDIMEAFLKNKLCFVAGSTWAEDYEVFLEEIQKHDMKIVIAPDTDKKVLILDTIGILSKIYSYANWAYVGGGMRKKGLHNILEPTVFGIPVIIGAKYTAFYEAVQLVKNGGVISVKTKQEFKKITKNLIADPKKRKQLGLLNKHFLESQKGSTARILEKLSKKKMIKISFKK